MKKIESFSDNKKNLEDSITKSIKEFERNTEAKVSWIDIKKKKCIGFSILKDEKIVKAVLERE